MSSETIENPHLIDNTERVVIIGGPFSGKSTLAKEYAERGISVYCTDAPSQTREVIEGVVYMPEKMEWSEVSEHIVKTIMPMEGWWVLEGVAAVRALRKWLETRPDAPLPVTKIIVLRGTHQELTNRQEGMRKGIFKVWDEIADRINPDIIEEKQVNA